ncbi:DUF6868 family protein [Pseudomonas citronellolis]|uniref:DUF6868 family protein n=1 Tax=Pseudomonas citronellolis TaxID=53408 RepID=UPI0023E472C7|nr:hypothetical protein [Pseudomonas citronellolis]MDF3933867.1 hypothetical protein [Pseudomonas citronellolis]
MNLHDPREFLLWCLLINYAVLLLWFGAFSLAHDDLYRLHKHWFGLAPETFDALHYGGMAVYKIGILLLNLTPLLALWITGD